MNDLQKINNIAYYTIFLINYSKYQIFHLILS